ncbi:MAG TPA: GGDEF domain-containing protein [Deltaproteobacteria bacterium]|nr:GGDEF domain-containing protein [Deltaproteobacteria bacterium]
MLFRKRDKGTRSESAHDPDPTDEAGGGPPPGDPVPADQALDFMAEMLRIMGENAFDIGTKGAEEIEAFFEAWARHLLIGIPPPGREKPADDESGKKKRETGEATPRESRRDLPGLRRAFRDHRETEAGYVTKSLGDFRSATWAFINGLRRSLTAEQNSDRRISHRMRRLEGAVRRGDPDAIKNEAQQTVTLLTEFLAERGTRHQEQISAMAARLEGLRDELDNVRAQAAIDPVTEIYNRASFDEQIEREVDLATLFGRRGCLLMIDIDHFKWVNDTHGHPCGDEVLKQFAATLTRCFMRRDDFVARYGGEEFVVVLRDIDLPTARDVAERGMTAIRNLEVHFGELEEPIRLTASIGIARLRVGETASAWVERADRALYQAKNGGRDRIEVDPIDLEEA